MSSIYGSAAGANVIYGKNNIGVAFSAPAIIPCEDVEQEQLLTDDGRPIYKVTEGGTGMWLATSEALGVGATLKKFSGFVKASGSPTGTLYCRVYNQTSPPSLSATLETQADTTFAANTISTSSYEEKEFIFDGSYTLKVGDFILLWYTEGSPAYLLVQFQSSDVYDGTDTQAGWHQVDGGGFIANSSFDATMKITYCE